MSGLLRTALALGAALMMSMGPAAANEKLGIYQTTDRKMDFELSTCGSGKDLCVRLLDARGSARTWQVRPNIGKLVVNKAKSSGNNRWNGSMRVGDVDLNGRMVLRPGRDFKINGCAYIVVCHEITLIPAK